MKTKILTEILHLTEKVGGFRAMLIGFIFPEFTDILGKLVELSAECDRNP